MTRRLAGYEFLPTALYQQQLQEFLQQGNALGGAMMQPPRPAVPVFEDDLGNAFMELPGDEATSMVPLLKGSPLAGAAGAPASGGGFVPATALEEIKPDDELLSLYELVQAEVPVSERLGWLDRVSTQALLSAAPGSPTDDIYRSLGIENPLQGGPLATLLSRLQQTAMMKDDLAAEDTDGSNPSSLDSLALMLAKSQGTGIFDQTNQLLNEGLKQSSMMNQLMPGGCTGPIGPPKPAIDTKAVVDEATKKLLEQWEVDDDSSTAEHIAHKAVKESKKHLKTIGKDIINQESKFKKMMLGLFKGQKPGNGMPAVRQGDIDEFCDTSNTGVAKILFQGQPVSRKSDPVVGPKAPAPGVPILQGSPSVLAAGQAVTHVCASTAVPSHMMTGACTIFVGYENAPPPKAGTPTPPGQPGNASPTDPKSPNVPQSGGQGGAAGSGGTAGGNASSGNVAASPAAQGQTGANPASYELDKDGKRTIGGFKVDPNDPHAVREAEKIDNLPVGQHDPESPMSDTSFRIDGEDGRAWDHERGMSLSNSEYNKLWDTPTPLRELLQADGTVGTLGVETTPGNWYLLGGLIDLGSPMNPGAGNSFAWWVPDKIFGRDMSPYYMLHDWRFRPGEFGKEGRSIADMFTEWEIPAFLSGMAAAGDDPLHAGLQVIYSGTTSLVSLGMWTAARFGDKK